MILEAAGIHCVYLFNNRGENSALTVSFTALFHLSNLYAIIVIII